MKRTQQKKDSRVPLMIIVVTYITDITGCVFLKGVPTVRSTLPVA